jgi:hypothetical protein
MDINQQPDEEWTDADEEEDYKQAVRRRSESALLMAFGRYATDRYALEPKPLPLWLAEALCSSWGQSVIADAMREAETVLNAAHASEGVVKKA